MTQHAIVRQLPSNDQGKDFIVGDIHGCLTLLLRLLDAVNFDKSRDRLFSVGDLIDRGPHSLECLYLSASPWFYAVQGNHEQLLLECFSAYLQTGQLTNFEEVADSDLFLNGGDWVERYFITHHHCMRTEFNQALLEALAMPLIWIVGEGDQRFHVVHAELLKPGYRDLEIPVWQDADIDQWFALQAIPPEVQDRLCWSRTMMTQAVRNPMPRNQEGLSPTFCGHSYDPRPRQVLSHVCIDTGAFLTSPSFVDQISASEDFGLTFVDVANGRWVSASYRRDELVWGDLNE